MVDEADRVAVGALLGRQPLGAFEVVVRDESGAPVVIRNAPLLDDGTPMPTRWWLVGPTEVLAVSRLESSGGVRRAEAEIDATAIADAHRRYATERDAALPGGRHGRARRVASAARARASSASTPTTPGTSPAVTIPSGDGSPRG